MPMDPRDRRPPPASVVTAFGGDPEAARALPGGAGRSWRVGPVVLKPGQDERLVAWTATFVRALDAGGRFRVAEHVAASDGRWVVDGWAATTWLDGAHLDGQWDRVLDVSRSFHVAAAATGFGPPAELAGRSDPWAVGDRVAWGEQPPPGDAPPALTRLLARLEPLLTDVRPALERQVIHGDLGGNVLSPKELGSHLR